MLQKKKSQLKCINPPVDFITLNSTHTYIHKRTHTNACFFIGVLNALILQFVNDFFTFNLDDSNSKSSQKSNERIIIGHEKSATHAERRSEITAALAKKYDGKSREVSMIIFVVKLCGLNFNCKFRN